jgi:predicted RecB family nuclease
VEEQRQHSSFLPIVAVRLAGSRLTLAATDLANFLACRHLTALSMAEARGKLKRPYYEDPLRDLLAQRGRDHENSYVASLEQLGHSVDRLERNDGDQSARERTLDAMQRGVQTIVQGVLANDTWFGRTDILRRVEKPCSLWPWSYEVEDTKLSSETRGGTILQLSLYTELLAEVQGTRPEFFHVVTR